MEHINQDDDNDIDDTWFSTPLRRASLWKKKSLHTQLIEHDIA